MIEVKNDRLFVLNTKNTTYSFCVTQTGHLEHLYYGKRIHINSADYLRKRHVFGQGNLISYDNEHMAFTLEDIRLEMSSYGKGDIREPFIELTHSDGNSTCDFLYKGYRITEGKRELPGLPSSYGNADEVKTLTIELEERGYDIALEIEYSVFEDADVITRSARLINKSENSAFLNRLLSLQFDTEAENKKLTTFHGTWIREMEKYEQTLVPGKIVNESMTGTSSNRTNPFFMLSDINTTENSGDCYGFNLIYSGNHYEVAETNAFGTVRIVAGINPASFAFEITPGDDFQSPEAVMTYSGEGYGGMSRIMHSFVNNHIVRGCWKNRRRPVLINSWEASYFDINESKLLKLARAAKETGIELFVMDDGWFGKRDDDRSSLGDWNANVKKLPNGVKGLADKVKELGLDFGIWVEPEMISADSNLYRQHPDWAMEVPGQHHSEGRWQKVLDLTNPDVQDFLIEKMSAVFSGAPISYVKWDMNRIFSDVFSQALPANRQGEVAHRYVLGLYRVMGELTNRFPEILFEGCASGGNRFDLGILCYFPQIWGSDDTDPIERMRIQTNYSYGYPLSTVSAHVSGSPNHQTLRETFIDTRFNVACFGNLGYELNLADADKSLLEDIKKQVMLYKDKAELFQYGTLYRGIRNGNKQLTVVSPDKTEAVSIILQELVRPNPGDVTLRIEGLDDDTEYHFYNMKKKHSLMGFGDLVNTVAPIHIKQNSLVHKTIARFVSMEGETEDEMIYGDTLKEAGVVLKQPYSSTGYNDNVRYYPDFASRMYFFEKNLKEI